MPASLLTILRSRRFIAIAVLLMLVLSLPSLRTGLVLDDTVHRDLLLKSNAPKAVMELFRFVADDEDVVKWREAGAFPWYTHPHLRLAFWRPLSSLTHRIDYRLWPDNIPLQHLHNLAWAALMVTMAGILYRRLLGVRAATGIALLLYALDDAHGIPTAWIANRNSLVATTFGLATLILHDQWRSRQFKPAAPLAFGCFLLSLLGAEFGAATGAYLLSYALFLEDEERPLHRRLLTIAPYVALGILWQLAYSQMGFGARHSLMYLDPVREPLRYVAAVPERMTLLLGGLYGFPPSDLHGIAGTGLRHALMGIAVGWIVVVAMVIFRPVSSSPMARFFGLGSVLALLPVVATAPADRLLLLSGFGAFGLFALFLAELRGRWRAPGTRATTKLLAVMLGCWHGLIAPLGLAGAGLNVRALGEMVSAEARTMPFTIGDGARSAYCLNAPGTFLFAMAQVERKIQGLPLAGEMHGLASGYTSVTIERPDTNTLRVSPQGGFLLPEGASGGGSGPLVSLRYLSQVLEGLYTPSRTLWREGDVLALGDVKLLVHALTPDHRPATVDFTFPAPLEDDRFLWLRFTGKAYRSLELPAVGGQVVLPPARFQPEL